MGRWHLYKQWLYKGHDSGHDNSKLRADKKHKPHKQKKSSFLK